MKQNSPKAVPHVKEFQPQAILFLIFLFAILGVLAGLTVLVDEPSDVLSTSIIGLVILIPGIVFGASLLWGYLRAKRLDQFGTMAEGRIVDRWVEKHSDESDEYFVAYQFGDGVRVTQNVKGQEFQILSVGTPVTVRYLPNRPTCSRMELSE
jgi:hypothetical protein